MTWYGSVPIVRGYDFWENLIKTQLGTWKRLLKKAKLHAIVQEKNRNDADNFNRELLALLESYHISLRPSSAVQPSQVEAPLPFACIPCRKIFASKTAWATHSFRVHARLAPARYLANQTACDHCQHVFLNEHRLYLHLRTSTACFDALRGRGVHFQPVPGRGSSKWNAAEQFTFARFCMLQV